MIRRTMVPMALAFVLGEATAIWLGDLGLSLLSCRIFLLITGLCGIFFVFLAITDKFRKGLSMVAFLLFIGGMLVVQRQYTFIRTEPSGTTTIYGNVFKVLDKEKSTQISLKAEDGQRLLIVADKGRVNRIDPGDFVRISGDWTVWSRAQNEGNFDEQKYYRSLGYTYKLKLKNVEGVIHDDWDYRSFANRVMSSCKETLQKICPQRSKGLFQGILLGDKTELDPDIKTLYQMSGISHVLAISGLHVQILGMGLYKLLRRKLKYLPSVLMATVLILFYGICIGATESSMRAVIMLICSFLAKWKGRTYDGCSALAFSILWILAENPWALTNIGFLLSISAIAGVYLVYPVFSEFFLWKSKIAKSFLFSVSVQLFMLPVLINGFYEIAVYGVILNLIVIPCMSVVVGSGMIGMIVGGLLPAAARIIIYPGHLILQFYEWICQLFLKLPGSSLCVGAVSIKRILCYYSLLGVICVLLKWRTKCRPDHTEYLEEKKKVQIDFFWIRVARNVFFVVLCVAFSCLLCLKHLEENRISFLDVGQGDCSVVHLKNHTVMIDAGSTSVKKVGQYRISSYMKYHGITKVDYLFLTHSDADHMNAIQEFLENERLLKIDCLILGHVQNMDGYQTLLKAAKKSGTKVRYVNRGDQIRLGDMNFTVCYPTIDVKESDNAGSMVLKLQMDQFCGIFPGDLGIEQEDGILKEIALPHKVDVLKTGHHGSKYSSGENWLSWLQPKISVISAGEGNRYGHPHQELLERLRSSGSYIISTKNKGQITLTLDFSNHMMLEYFGNKTKEK